MQRFKWFLAGLAGLLVLLYLLGWFLPAENRAERSVLIETPAAVPYEFLTDLERVPQWMLPFADPDAGYQTRVAADGRQLHFSRGGESGAWRIAAAQEEAFVILRSMDREEMELQFEGVEPGGETRLFFGVRAPVEHRFDLSPERRATRLIWEMRVDFGNNIPGRYLGVFLDELMASEMHQSLMNLRGLSRQAAETPFEE